jgi:hypothetical protein
LDAEKPNGAYGSGDSKSDDEAFNEKEKHEKKSNE